MRSLPIVHARPFAQLRLGFFEKREKGDLVNIVLR